MATVRTCVFTESEHDGLRQLLRGEIVKAESMLESLKAGGKPEWATEEVWEATIQRDVERLQELKRLRRAVA